jgi:acetyltransferase
MSIRNMHHFLAPHSVAVIGASARAGSVGSTALAKVVGGWC